MGDTGKCPRLLVLLLNMFFPTRLNAQEQRELQGRMEKKQMKEFMTVSLIPLCALAFAHPGAFTVSTCSWALLTTCD